MPIARLRHSRRTRSLAACALLAASVFTPARGAEPAAVAIVRSAAWSPNDAARAGAEEMMVMITVARLQRENARAGVVGIGNRRGVFDAGTEQALRFAVLSGVPVVKVAPGDDIAACPDGLFVVGLAVSEAEASRCLTAALERCGPTPRAANPAQPSPMELEAIRAHVRALQEHFALARAAQVVRN